MCAKNKTGLQRKLSIGASNDPLEQEADRVAEQVMATPAHSAVSSAPSRIQRYTVQAAEGSVTAPTSVDRVLASSGRPFEPALREDMEQRFGHDFSQVRVHSGSAAEQSAQDVNANAYTVGHNVVFGAGQFAPGTHGGRRLLAHELTHVVQQSGTEGNRFTHIQREEVSTDDTKPRDESLGLGESIVIEGLTAGATVGMPLIKPVIKGGFTGFYTEIRHQIKEGKGQQFMGRVKKLLVSPGDMLAYGKGYLWGMLLGLWSPIQGIVDIVKLAWKLQQWQIQSMVNVIQNFQEIATMQGSLIERFSKLGGKAKAFLAGIGNNAMDFVGRLMGAISGGVFELAKTGGHKAGQAIFKFLEKPWGEIGEGVGTVVGTVLVEVGLAFASGGIGNALTKVGQVLDKVAPTLMKGVRFIASELGVIIKEIHAVVETIKKGLADAGHSLLKGLEDFIGEAGSIFDDLIAMLKKLFTGAEEAATKLPVDVPLPVKAPAPHAPAATKAPHIEAPGSKPLVEAKLPKEPNAEIGTAKKPQAELTPPKEPPIAKSPSDAVNFVNENPKLIKGEPGHRRASVGDGHEIVEVPNSNMPSGIGCELHSKTTKVECPDGWGTTKQRKPFANDPDFAESIEQEQVKLGVKRPLASESPSDLENLQSKRGSTHQKATWSADLGVAEGKKKATSDGFTHLFDNPRGMEHNVPGIDSIYKDKAGNLVIIEFKGGGATLSEKQMTRKWVSDKIVEMENHQTLRDHPLVKDLRKAFDNKKLSGKTYSTPVDQVTGEVLETIVENHGIY